MVCQLFVILWIVSSEVPGKVFISSWSVVMPGILLLVAFLLLRRFIPHQLTRQRLLVIYAMLAVSSCLVGYEAIQAMYPAIATQFYGADAANNWNSFNKYVPTWLVPHSQAALKGLFIGHASVPWRAWMIPLLAWGSFICALAFAMLAIALLLSRQWITGERLAFPIAQLPLEITSERSSFYRNKLFWFGFGIAAILESLLALNYYFPFIPAIQLKHIDYGYLFPNPPWSALEPFYIGFTPFIIGFAYLAPTDISFSIFFFGILDRLIQVLTVALGGQPASLGAYMKQAPFSQQQSLGAFLAFAIIPLVRAFQTRRQETKLSRTCGEWGAISLLAISGLFLFSFLHEVGLSLLLSGVIIVLLLLFAVALTRIRAEAGPVWAFGPYGGLMNNLVNVTGSAEYTPAVLANLSTMHWMSADMRFMPMPFQMESLKIADSGGISRRNMSIAILCATVFGVATGLISVLWLEYRIGLQSGKIYGGVSYWQVVTTSLTTNWIGSASHWDKVGIPWIIIGALVTIGLGVMRQRFLWWPLHPIGYVLAHTGTGVSFWDHYFIAWLVKSLVLRYGGMNLYRKSIPLVIGLIMGDIISMSLWSAGAVILHIPVYQFIT